MYDCYIRITSPWLAYAFGVYPSNFFDSLYKFFLLSQHMVYLAVESI